MHALGVQRDLRGCRGWGRSNADPALPQDMGEETAPGTAPGPAFPTFTFQCRAARGEKRAACTSCTAGKRRLGLATAHKTVSQILCQHPNATRGGGNAPASQTRTPPPVREESFLFLILSVKNIGYAGRGSNVMRLRGQITQSSKRNSF